jgi:hypothetical protein
MSVDRTAIINKVIVGTTAFDVTPIKIVDSTTNYSASLSTLTADSTLALTSDITTAVATKADDSAVVHLTGDETVAGDKKFASISTYDSSLSYGLKIAQVKDVVNFYYYSGLGQTSYIKLALGTFALTFKRQVNFTGYAVFQGEVSLGSDANCTTQTVGDNSTYVASTAFVTTAVTTAVSGTSGNLAKFSGTNTVTSVSASDARTLAGFTTTDATIDY